MGLLYKLSDTVKYVCHIGLRSNGCFMTSAALMDSHYRTDIISVLGHPSDSVVLLVLCTVAYNIWGIGVVLQVPQDSANSTEKGNYDL